MTEPSLRGVLAPVLTPVDADLNIDLPRFVEHCRWLLANGCHGLVIFGTNSEATSFSAAERKAGLEGLLDAGLPAEKLVVGTGTPSIVESADLTRHAVEAGCHGTLTLPPFYYPHVSDEGLFRSFAAIIEGVNDDRLRMYLYHIPQVSGVPLHADLLARLAENFPGQAAGVKDSSGDPENLARFQGVAQRYPGFAVFCGTEGLLLRNLRGGGVGTISGMANVIPDQIRDLYENWQAPDADARQERVNWLRRTVVPYNGIAALKVIVAERTGHAGWTRVRPPLVDLTPEQQQKLLAAVRAAEPVPVA